MAMLKIGNPDREEIKYFSNSCGEAPTELTQQLKNQEEDDLLPDDVEDEDCTFVVKRGLSVFVAVMLMYWFLVWNFAPFDTNTVAIIMGSRRRGPKESTSSPTMHYILKSPSRFYTDPYIKLCASLTMMNVAVILARAVQIKHFKGMEEVKKEESDDEANILSAQPRAEQVSCCYCPDVDTVKQMIQEAVAYSLKNDVGKGDSFPEFNNKILNLTKCHKCTCTPIPKPRRKPKVKNEMQPIDAMVDATSPASNDVNRGQRRLNYGFKINYNARLSADDSTLSTNGKTASFVTRPARFCYSQVKGNQKRSKLDLKNYEERKHQKSREL